MKAEQERVSKASGARGNKPAVETDQDTTASASKGALQVSIKPLDFQVVQFTIVGDAPYVQNKFSAKATAMIVATQKAGSVAQSKRKREPKDFDALYEAAMHVSTEGWHGMREQALEDVRGLIAGLRKRLEEMQGFAGALEALKTVEAELVSAGASR